MRGHGFQDAAQQGADFQWAMVGNGDVVSPSDGGREADVGALLPCLLVTEHPQGADEIGGDAPQFAENPPA